MSIDRIRIIQVQETTVIEEMVMIESEIDLQ